MGLTLFPFALAAGSCPATIAEKTIARAIGLRLRIITMTLHLLLCPIGHLGRFLDGHRVSGFLAVFLLPHPRDLPRYFTIANRVCLEGRTPRFPLFRH